MDEEVPKIPILPQAGLARKGGRRTGEREFSEG